MNWLYGGRFNQVYGKCRSKNKVDIAQSKTQTKEMIRAYLSVRKFELIFHNFMIRGKYSNLWVNSNKFLHHLQAL